jgi:heavy metal efflux system protein
MERILAFSVRRRWLVLLLTIAAAISGAWSLTKLPIDAVPDVTNVQVQINAMAPALSPIEIEKQVTFPIETALAGTPGLESTRSFSRNGFAQVTAIFTDKTDIYFARQQVAERLTEAKSNLPPGVEVKMGPISTGLGEIYWWSVEYAPPGEGVPVRDGKPGWQSDGSYLTPDGERLTDDFRRTVYLRTVQDWIIRPQMKSVPGVAGADAIGGYVKQYQVQPDPARLIAYGLSFGQIVKAIEANNVSRGANYIERNGEGYVVRTSGRVETLAEIEDIVVATRGAVPVRIKDVAEVRLGRELRTGSASVNGREVVLGTALMLIGGNSRTVAAAADAKIKEINRTLPPSIRAQTVLNRTELVEATIRTVATNLAEGALLVILVLFLLLGNFRAALITAMVIPVTMLITATGMLEAKLSANLMSLGALDFGLIVDGAVIIVENSLRHLAERQRELGRTLSLDEHLDTVTTSAKEMIQPTVYGQAIIMLVYVPLLTFTGVEGKTFMPMAMTVIIALATAFVLSLTFVPAMIAIAVTGRVQEKENLFVRGLKVLYRPALAATIRSPLPVIASAALLFVGAAVLFMRLGQEFTPTLDEKNIVMEVKRIPSTSLSQSQSMQLANEDMAAGCRRSRLSFRARAPPTWRRIPCPRVRPTPTSFSSHATTGPIRTCRKRI